MLNYPRWKADRYGWQVEVGRHASREARGRAKSAEIEGYDFEQGITEDRNHFREVYLVGGRCEEDKTRSSKVKREEHPQQRCLELS
jgi:hypothetical protein